MTPKKWWQFLLLFILVGSLTVVVLTALAVTLIYPTLPSLEALTNYHPKQPLRVYTADNYLIGEFGEERRAYIDINDVPKNLKQAVLAIEDRRFYQHQGIDTTGVLRAIKNNVSGRAHEGASTITMQVAKNFFTGPDQKRNMITKIKEALLAIKIEKALNKDQILELYLNQIYLGQRSYGFSAASQVYYDKPLSKLTLAECALLAGLPKAPSGYNPFVHPQKAITRQHEVLRDMFRYGFIDETSYKEAIEQKLVFKTATLSRAFNADYVAELARQLLYEHYGDDIYRSGLKVYTTITKTDQEAANKAVVTGILQYQQRQGYQKAEKWIDLSGSNAADLTADLQSALDSFEEYNGLIPAIVTNITPKAVTVYSKRGDFVDVSGPGLALLQKNLAEKDQTKHKIKYGSVVRIVKNNDQWTIVQLPEVESALVALDPKDGSINAMVGGFDYNRNKFNHATQAWRQAGSSFKPFIYSAALEKGFTPASVVEDEPINMSAEDLGGSQEWSPKNYDGQYEGPMRLRTALTKSKNMVSIRVLDSIGPKYAQDYITKFGFARKDHPAYLTMALGAGEVTPLGLANAYAIFANGGYRIEPHIIAKITDSNGRIIEEKTFPQAGKDAPRVIDQRNAFLMTSMMQDVVQKGTATRAKALGRQDLAGKTGTTNNLVDAWFAGYSPAEVAVAWIGYDKPQTLGRLETGGKAALPIWITYMATALKNVPDQPMPMPDGVMELKIDPATGTLADNIDDGITEYFYQENPPPSVAVDLPAMQDPEDSAFPPDNLPNNPLQPAPPRNLPNDPTPEQARPTAPSKVDNAPVPANTKASGNESTLVKKPIEPDTASGSEAKPNKNAQHKSSSQRAVDILNPSGF